MKLKVIKLSELTVNDRFRSDYDDPKEEGGSIERLANDMKVNGIIQPIAVKETSDGQYILLAGGRRTIAAAMAGIDEIPVRIYDESLTEIEMRSIELSENLWRKNFSPAEKAMLYREIQRLEETIHGKKISTSPDAAGVSIKDTADKLGVSAPTISEAIALANFMDLVPDVDWKSMTTTSEAMKTKKMLENKIVRKEMVKRAEEELGTADSRKRRITDAYLVNDFFAGSEHIPDETFDLIEVDPPYAIRIQQQKKTDGSMQNNDLAVYNEIDPKAYPAFMKRVFKQCYRMAKPNAWLLCWFGPDPWFDQIYTWLNDAGFSTSRLVGLWVKGEVEDDIIPKTSGQSHNPTEQLANAYEMFFYAKKGRPKMARAGQTNVYGYKPIPPGQKTHPTERPMELMRDLLTTFAEPNSRLLVPFAGSGNTLLAGALEKMIPVGFDITPEYKESYVLKVQAML